MNENCFKNAKPTPTTLTLLYSEHPHNIMSEKTQITRKIMKQQEASRKAVVRQISCDATAASAFSTLDNVDGTQKHVNDTRKHLRACLRVKTLQKSIEIANKQTDNRDENAVTTIAQKRDHNLSVRFGIVQVRLHEIILGDNPAVGEGAPLTIDWEPFYSFDCPINEYRADTIAPRCPTRMKIPPDTRFNLLAKTMAKSEIRRGIKKVKEARRQRAETRTTLYRAKSQENIERLTRGFKNLVTNKKKKERRFIAQAMVK